MFGPSGVGQIRGVTLGPQPLKATIPYQLSCKPRSHRRDGKTAGKPKSHQLSSGMRRTMSLDAIIGPYLQGHWPKEPEGPSSPSRKDKSTQTPDACAEHLREIAKLKQQLQQRSKPAVSGGHDKDRQCGYPQGSCSLGTTQTQPIPIPLSPLCTLVPRLRCSVEGLNQELEGMFICQPAHPQHRLLEVPDGHRAPVPPQSCSSGSQNAPLVLQQGLTDGADMCLLSPFSSHNEADLSSSPGPNKSCCFQREPPEGCERVKVWEETSSPRQPMPALLSSCPDPNKVNFTPYGGSAFCPVSLLRPLLPSMDMLFRSLAISPAGFCSSQGTGQAPPDPPSASPAVVGESSGEGLAF
ncbi:Protein FAM117A [Dissostichus eleginoides]|uniref:Protein FAM117A n=1 Tax=Dissostichus eleginoides TaxID=100907 RepID=A0AAD9BE24_DISEL|nr:Protein FAM117A [Dissostichus eleginoides]